MFTIQMTRDRDTHRARRGAKLSIDGLTVWDLELASFKSHMTVLNSFLG